MKAYLFLFVALASCTSKQSSQGEGFLSKVNQTNIQDDTDLLTFFDQERKPIPPAFTNLPNGSTRPKGWMLQLMQNDLQQGIVGALDELYPGIQSDDLYHENRRGGLDDVPEMGDLVLTGAEWEQSIMWWNAETIGNWWDGFIRHAFLTNDEKAMEQSHQIAANLLNSQDEDGYIGIYKPNLRYQHEGSNGELWAQTTAFRSLLGYYEFTQNKEVLAAVEKGMKVTMEAYGPEGKNPFELKNAFGGVTHGLMLTDVCEMLYRITGKQQYQDYAVYLYEAFSTFSINRAFNDFRYPYLMQKDSMFTGHAVHTYEHFRTLVNAYYETGYPELKTAYENSLAKLERCILPSGAGHGNEWIAALDANATTTASEYCSMLELRNSLTSLAQKTGDLRFADHAEKLTFNAMMGARNEEGTALAYGKHDNAYVLDGKHHELDHANLDPRYKYSPTHSDPAVCCVPNYTRNYTYFLDNMWMKREGGLAAILYGPSHLKTAIKGVDVSIEQKTNYPFEDEIVFSVKTASPISFELYLRKPAWSTTLLIDGEAVRPGEDGLYFITKEWSEDEIKVSFENNIQKVDFKDEQYFQKGALVYALSIPHRIETIKEYGLAGFKDFYCFPTDNTYESMSLTDDPFEFVSSNSNEFPWYNENTFLEGKMVNAITEQTESIRLIPVGSTILRRVTFPIN